MPTARRGSCTNRRWQARKPRPDDCIEDQGFCYARRGGLADIEFSHRMRLRQNYGADLAPDTRFTATGLLHIGDFACGEPDVEATGTFGS